RSTNRGESWQPVKGDFLPTTDYANVLRDGLAVDTLEPYGLYFGTSSGELFYSLDRGDTWQTIPGRFPRITAVKPWVLES
ncbi:MAG: exo-alpha-sialidase, partial [Chloroflexota bacterium]